VSTMLLCKQLFFVILNYTELKHMLYCKPGCEHKLHSLLVMPCVYVVMISLNRSALTASKCV